jgi:hypothetical protein
VAHLGVTPGMLAIKVLGKIRPSTHLQRGWFSSTKGMVLGLHEPHQELVELASSLASIVTSNSKITFFGTSKCL